MRCSLKGNIHSSIHSSSHLPDPFSVFCMRESPCAQASLRNQLANDDDDDCCPDPDPDPDTSSDSCPGCPVDLDDDDDDDEEEEADKLVVVATRGSVVAFNV